MIKYQGGISGHIDIKCNPKDVRINAPDISFMVALWVVRESLAGGDRIMLSIITGCISVQS